MRSPPTVVGTAVAGRVGGVGLFISSMSGVLRVVTWIVITNWDRRESTWSFSTDVLKPSLNRTLGRVVRYAQLELPQLNA